MTIYSIDERLSDNNNYLDFMHLSMVCPTIPLPHETKGYHGVFTGEAGPRVGHLIFLCIIT